MHDLFLFAFVGRDLLYSLNFYYSFVAVSYIHIFGWFLIRLVGSLAGFLLLFLRANSLGRGFLLVFIV